jgi:hypothetical protein
MPRGSFLSAWAKRPELNHAERAFLTRKLSSEARSFDHWRELTELVERHGLDRDALALPDDSSPAGALVQLEVLAGTTTALEAASQEELKEAVRSWWRMPSSMTDEHFTLFFESGEEVRLELLAAGSTSGLHGRLDTWVPWWVERFSSAPDGAAKSMASWLMSRENFRMEVARRMGLTSLVKLKGHVGQKVDLRALVAERLDEVLAAARTSQEDLVTADALVAKEVKKAGVRALVASDLLDRALALASRVEAHGLTSMTRTELTCARGRLKGWGGSGWPTLTQVRSRFDSGVVDDATFAAIPRTPPGDPLRGALTHKSATAARVAGLVLVEDLDAVLAGRSKAWRRDLLVKTWALRTEDGAVAAELLARTSDDELEELLDAKVLDRVWGERAALVKALGPRGRLVLERLRLKDLDGAPTRVLEAMLEELVKELGHSEAAMEAFATLEAEFEGTFVELLAVCSDL